MSSTQAGYSAFLDLFVTVEVRQKYRCGIGLSMTLPLDLMEAWLSQLDCNGRTLDDINKSAAYVTLESMKNQAT